MSGNLAEIYDQAMSLSQEDRAALVSRLWGSLDDERRLPPDEIEAVMTAYARDREIEDGTVETYTLDQVLAEMDNALNESHLS